MKLIVYFVIGLCLSAGAFGQQAKKLSLDNAVDVALRRNVQIIQAKNNVEASQSSTQAAWGSFLPTLDASGNFNNQELWSPVSGGTVVIGGFPVSTASGGYSHRTSWDAAFGARWTLFDGFANTSGYSRARYNEDATKHTLSRTEQTTINQTYQLFLNVSRTVQLVGVDEDNLKRSKRQLERITESNKVGAVALADVYRQQVQVGTDELSLIQAQSAYKKSIQDLVAYLGVDYDAEYTFDFSGIPTDIDTTEFNTVNTQYTDFDTLAGIAYQKRPDYLASNESVNGTDAGVSVARSGHYPTVNASASYGWNNSDLKYLNENKTLSINVGVIVPIFNGFAIQNQVEQATIQHMNASEALNQSKRQITVDLRKALLDLEASQKQLKVTKSSVFSADMDRKIAEEKYNLGAGTLLDLLVANANYSNSQSNQVNAVIGYLLSKKNMEYALGTISQ